MICIHFFFFLPVTALLLSELKEIKTVINNNNEMNINYREKLHNIYTVRYEINKA